MTSTDPWTDRMKKMIRKQKKTEINVIKKQTTTKTNVIKKQKKTKTNVRKQWIINKENKAEYTTVQSRMVGQGQ